MIFSLKEDLLTKQAINEKVSDQQIYEFYLGEEISLTKKYHSPYRVDKNPSLSIFETTSGRLLWRDWGDPEMSKANGVIALVMKINGNCSYMEALRHIDQDMGLNIETKVKLIGTKVIPAKKEIEKKPKKPKIIEVETQPFTMADVAYWDQYHIDLGTLVKYHVSSAKYVWVDKALVRTYSQANPVYSYHLGYLNTLPMYKIYAPYSERGKWLTNAGNNIVQGIDNVDWKVKDIILTKSLKDVMVLYKIGFQSFAVQHEGATLEAAVRAMIIAKQSNIFVLYDNDLTGKRESDKLIEKHPHFTKISIPDYLNELGIKDISDYVKKYGLEKGKILINNLINYEKYKVSDGDLPF